MTQTFIQINVSNVRRGARYAVSNFSRAISFLFLYAGEPFKCAMKATIYAAVMSSMSFAGGTLLLRT